jgi:hypothetical protein
MASRVNQPKPTMIEIRWIKRLTLKLTKQTLSKPCFCRSYFVSLLFAHYQDRTMSVANN